MALLTSTAWESAPTTMDALPAASQQVPAPTAPDVEELNGKNSFQYVIDSLPHHLRRIAHLEAFLEEAAEIPQKFFKTGRFLPRGDILLWLHKEYVTQRDTVSLPITSSPNDSRTPPKLLNVASSSTGFHSGSSRKTSTTFSERHRCNIADSPRNAFRRRLKS